MISFIFFTIILILIFIYSAGGDFSSSSIDFVAKGRERGLSTKDIKILKQVADFLELDKPLLLLGSLDHVDSAINALSSNLNKYGYTDIVLVQLLEDLYTYRKKIALRRNDKRLQITSSREISIKQSVKVTCGNMDNPFIGEVVDNSEKFIIIDFSKDSNFTSGITCDGFINIYFWKKGDAGYFFESVIIENLQYNKWKVAHCNELIRSQKRKEIRVATKINGYIHQIDDKERILAQIINKERR